MLKDLLESNTKIFKLVCGAGNECANDVRKLTELYSLSGAQVFDICAKPEILKAAKDGLDKAGIQKDRYICVSVGIKGDPHISKASIDKNKCNRCNICEKICPNSAVQKFQIIKEKCIGCGVCYDRCPRSAITMNDYDIDLNKVLPELIEMGIDCIELHATAESEIDIWDKWEAINTHFDGIVSICIDRLNLGNKQVLSRLKKMLKSRKPYTTIIQADGIPMSGSDDTYKTTLQAIAMSEIIQDANLPVYILISGGTNSKTAKLAKLCNLKYSGIAIGSYARKIVKDYIISGKNKDTALKLATELVKESIE